MFAAARRRQAVWVLLFISLVVQVSALYSPGGTGVAPFPHADKVAHLILFAIPTALASTLSQWKIVVAAIIVHAPVSELVQGFFIAGRECSVLDMVADLLGVGGVLLVRHFRNLHQQ